MNDFNKTGGAAGSTIGSKNAGVVLNSTLPHSRVIGAKSGKFSPSPTGKKTQHIGLKQQYQTVEMKQEKINSNVSYLQQVFIQRKQEE